MWIKTHRCLVCMKTPKLVGSITVRLTQLVSIAEQAGLSHSLSFPVEWIKSRGILFDYVVTYETWHTLLLNSAFTCAVVINLQMLDILRLFIHDVILHENQG